jgi:hypothetical protein
MPFIRHPFIRYPFIRHRRRRRIVAGATPALTVLAGALFINEGPAGAQDASSATPKLVWADCGDGLQCATARVPLDYDHPNGKKISLAVIRRPATDRQHRIGSLFVNNGGPGNSVLDFVRGDAAQVLTPRCRPASTSSASDPRRRPEHAGACFTDVDEQGQFFGSRPGLPVGPDEVDAFTRDQELGRLCGQQNGDLLDHLSPRPTWRRDMDLLRRAVGDPQLSFAGYSYARPARDHLREPVSRPRRHWCSTARPIPSNGRGRTATPRRCRSPYDSVAPTPRRRPSASFSTAASRRATTAPSPRRTRGGSSTR